MTDRNKTEITLRITEAASYWLHNIGAKAIETEVYVGHRWIADLAAFWSPTATEAQQTKLIMRRPPYNLNLTEEKQKEYDVRCEIWKKQIENLPQIITIVHEIKTSVNDFKSDKKWKHKPIADLQVLSYLRGCVTEIPENWWGLEHSETGKLIAVRYRSPLNKIDDSQRLQIVSQIAERRHNRTANEFFRELQKKHTIEDGDRKRNQRLSSCMSSVISILKGERGSVEKNLKYHFQFNAKIPAYIVEKLQELYGKLPQIKGD